MEQEELKEVFIKFLNDNNCYHEFLTNIREEYNIDIETVFNYFSHYNWICFAFSWRRSEQGYEYWDKINDKWIDLLEDLED